MSETDQSASQYVICISGGGNVDANRDILCALSLCEWKVLANWHKLSPTRLTVMLIRYEDCEQLHIAVASIVWTVSYHMLAL
jgi:hypothetical protein